jgi:DNA-binding MarR family transcriptional regulator
MAGMVSPQWRGIRDVRILTLILCQDADMAQPRTVDVDRSIGLALKRAAVSLNAAMEEELRPLGLTVSQYACLEQLRRRPEQSSAQLARAMFVTRQSMNEVLRGLQARRLLDRSDDADRGRARAARLTRDGAALLTRASRAVAGVEERMLTGLDPASRDRLRDDLERCIAALRPPQPSTPGAA